MNKVTKEMLYMVCDNTHAFCNYSCPVYSLMTEVEQEAKECKCHKNPEAMYEFCNARLK